MDRSSCRGSGSLLEGLSTCCEGHLDRTLLVSEVAVSESRTRVCAVGETAVHVQVPGPRVTRSLFRDPRYVRETFAYLQQKPWVK